MTMLLADFTVVQPDLSARTWSIFWVVLAYANLALTAFAALEIATTPFKPTYHKVVWLFLVLFLPLLGPLFYLDRRRELLA